jgi:hypothetical protein
MSTRPESPDSNTPPLASSPSWNAPMRLTKEQLAAAERTREYHVRKLQEQVIRAELPAESRSRAEH